MESTHAMPTIWIFCSAAGREQVATALLLRRMQPRVRRGLLNVSSAPTRHSNMGRYSAKAMIHLHILRGDYATCLAKSEPFRNSDTVAELSRCRGVVLQRCPVTAALLHTSPATSAAVTGQHCNSSPMPEQPRYGSTISRPLRHTRLRNPTVRVHLQ